MPRSRPRKTFTAGPIEVPSLWYGPVGWNPHPTAEIAVSVCRHAGGGLPATVLYRGVFAPGAYAADPPPITIQLPSGRTLYVTVFPPRTDGVVRLERIDTAPRTDQPLPA